MISPPEFAIEAALSAAKQSPCQKSKRGVAVYRMPSITAERPDRDPVELARVVDVIGCGYNAQPAPFTCGNACRRVETIPRSAAGVSACSMLCIHAEENAIRTAQLVLAANGVMPLLTDCQLVHVKIDSHGNLLGGGGPSCWQCSRAVVSAHLGGVWLYETTATGDVRCLGCNAQHPAPDAGKRCPYCDAGYFGGCSWRFYTAIEFHHLTMLACALPVQP